MSAGDKVAMELASLERSLNDLVDTARDVRDLLEDGNSIQQGLLDEAKTANIINIIPHLEDSEAAVAAVAEVAERLGLV